MEVIPQHKVGTYPYTNKFKIAHKINTMPSCKSDITITIKAGEKSFTIGGVLLPDGKYAIKSGRSWSTKKPRTTLTDIFTQARKWAVKNGPF